MSSSTSDLASKIQIADYSAKTIAVFGETKTVKDQLKEMGGKFNKSLTQGNSKKPGWIFAISEKAAVQEWLKTCKPDSEAVKGKHPDSIESALSVSNAQLVPKPLRIAFICKADRLYLLQKPSEDDSNTSQQLPPSNQASSPPPSTSLSKSSNEAQLIEYSNWSLAVYGDTIPIKDQLKALGGKFNRYLDINGEKKAGWIVPKDKKEMVLALLKEGKASPGTSDKPPTSISSKSIEPPMVREILFNSLAQSIFYAVWHSYFTCEIDKLVSWNPSYRLFR
jgi:hypothetical protein